MKIIEIENLSHRFSSGRLGLDRVSLSVSQGEFLILAGRNGSGKTTLLRHMNGLLSAQTGTVKVMGRPVSESPARARRLIGMVFQDADSQILGETVQEDVAFGPENLRVPRAEIEVRVRAALEAVDLADKAEQRPHTLSGGEKRRLTIAGVLAMQPEMIVFDEPFSNLDHPATVMVLKEILALHRSGRAVLVATHELEKIVAHAGRLVILDQGRIVRDGPPEALVGEVEAFGIRRPCLTRLGLDVPSWLS